MVGIQYIPKCFGDRTCRQPGEIGLLTLATPNNATTRFKRTTTPTKERGKKPNQQAFSKFCSHPGKVQSKDKDGIEPAIIAFAAKAVKSDYRSGQVFRQ
jgi:hypothetical protein